MVTDTISVGWDGTVYDCDFNQQLGLPTGGVENGIKKRLNITQLQSAEKLQKHGEEARRDFFAELYPNIEP